MIFQAGIIPWCSILPVGKNDDDILFCEKMIPSMKLTFSHLKMDGWNIFFSFGGPAYFQVQVVSFRERTYFHSKKCGFTYFYNYVPELHESP